ncbi:hypothetical protein C8J56DRAFT_955237 [Mycena floridula]|nr:hypothetical protein C8J56DRAFT_955237 [Mycena floridula]
MDQYAPLAGFQSLTSFSSSDMCWPPSIRAHSEHNDSLWSWQSSDNLEIPNYFPPSPSACSSLSLTPPPFNLQGNSTVHYCNAPLIAPKPLPFHSPTFLEFELLPDLDEDLSHPPYTRRTVAPSKRKREGREGEGSRLVKRRALSSSWPQSNLSPSMHSRNPYPACYPPSAGHYGKPYSRPNAS